MPRLFVCDPACVQAFGHNATTLKYYYDTFNNNYEKVFVFGCELIDKTTENNYNIIPFYRFYYSKYFKNIKEYLEVQRPIGQEALGFGDELEWIATEDAKRMLEDYACTQDDRIVFPHLDFYGVIGMLNAIEARDAALQPKLYLRFIGVMENATATYRFPVGELLSRIQVALDRGLHVRLSAETPLYADFIANELSVPVTVTSYPNNSEQIPLDENGPFIFYCPGSARHDKGFDELFYIITSVRKRDKACKIRFISQIFPDSELTDSLPLVRRLYSLPGVELQQGAISADLMLSTYRRTHAVLLPYDRTVYKWRGSAVLMEAAALGRPAISYDGMAFADLIRHYKLGRVVGNRAGMVKAIFDLAFQPRRDIQLTAMQARHRFHSDNAASYRIWMEY